MFASLKKTVVATLIGLGALASTPAFADRLTVDYIITGPGGDRGWERERDRDGVRNWGRDGGRDWGRYDERQRDWRRDDRRARGCSPWRAVEKAERMGIRRARVVDAGYRGVVVRGQRWGDRVNVVFGNDPYCPVRGVY